MPDPRLDVLLDVLVDRLLDALVEHWKRKPRRLHVTASDRLEDAWMESMQHKRGFSSRTFGSTY